MRFLADTDQGPVPVEITGIEGDEVIVDGNHMLAGQNLKFHVEIVAIREATEEELAHGHVHGEDEGHECCGDMATVKKADAVVVVMITITVKKVDVVVAVMEKVVTATVMAVVVANINLVKPLKRA